MEKVIFQQAIARLDGQAAYFITKGTTKPAVHAWYEGQPENSQVDKPESFPFDVPAVFYEFSPTKYREANGIHVFGNGEITLHLVQLKTGKDPVSGMERHTQFIADLDYADVIIDLLNFYRLPCSAKLILIEVLRDQTNNPIRVDKVKFKWDGRRRKDTTAP